MSCICFFCHSAQQSLQISSATRWPSSFGMGGKARASLLPQRVHLNLSPNRAIPLSYHRGIDRGEHVFVRWTKKADRTDLLIGELSPGVNDEFSSRRAARQE